MSFNYTNDSNRWREMRKTMFLSIADSLLADINELVNAVR